MFLTGLWMLANACVLIQAGVAIDNHLSFNQQDRFRKLFSDGLGSNDLQSIYYGAINAHQLKQSDMQKACDRLKPIFAESEIDDFERNFYLIAAYKELNCSYSMTEEMLNAVKISLTATPSSLRELYFNYFTNSYAGVTINESKKSQLVSSVLALLSDNKTALSLGYAFGIGADLGSASSALASFVSEQTISELLTFENDLSTTATLLTAMFKLANATNTSTPIDEQQTQKFVEYFLSDQADRSVERPKEASELEEVLSMIAENRKIAPICIRISGNSSLPIDWPVATINVVDILGNTLEPKISSVTATVTSKPDNRVLISRDSLVPRSSDGSIFALDLRKVDASAGNYTAEIIVGEFRRNCSIEIFGTRNEINSGVESTVYNLLAIVIAFFVARFLC